MNEIKCMRKTKHRNLQTRKINKSFRTHAASILGQSLLPLVQCLLVLLIWRQESVSHISRYIMWLTVMVMWPTANGLTGFSSCTFTHNAAVIHKTVISLCQCMCFCTLLCKQIIICCYKSLFSYTLDIFLCEHQLEVRDLSLQ